MYKIIFTVSWFKKILKKDTKPQITKKENKFNY